MKTPFAIAVLVAFTLVPSLAFAYPVTPGTVAVHSYQRGGGARVGSYLRRAPGRASSAHGINGAVLRTSGGPRVMVRDHVRNNPSGTQSLVRQHASSHQFTTTVTGHGPPGAAGPGPVFRTGVR